MIHAGPERAAHADDLLVQEVGDLVRRAAQLARPAADRQAQQRRLLGHVEELELDADRRHPRRPGPARPR